MTTKRYVRSFFALLLALIFLCGLLPGASAAETGQLQSAITRTASCLRKSVPTPQYGDEWLILGMARSGASVSKSCFRDYYASVERYAAQCGGVLHAKRYTEYSRVVVALTAIGADPSDVGGFDLLAPLGDYDAVVAQGLNGAIWALIALDCGDYAVPVNGGGGTQATRQMYVDLILSRQLEDGGWSLSKNGPADTDMTAMALQALAGYRDQEPVRRAVERGLSCLGVVQNDDGGFSSYGVPNAESCAQVVVALGELGVEPTDVRFVKNGRTVLAALLDFQNADGSFRYRADDAEGSVRTTTHVLYALDAARRVQEGRSSLYRMNDVETGLLDAPAPTPAPSEQPPSADPAPAAAGRMLLPLLPSAGERETRPVLSLLNDPTEYYILFVNGKR